MPSEVAGLLLCGGAATRFGGGKLLAGSPPLAARACAALRSAVPRVIAVVPPGDEALRQVLAAAGAHVVPSARTVRGMGASLAAAVAAAPEADGWIVALGDMPSIRPGTHAAVRDALAGGALLAAACEAGGRRGHPVGFASALRDELLALDGDHGARDVVSRHAARLHRVVVDDPGIFVDIDTPADFARLG